MKHIRQPYNLTFGSEFTRIFSQGMPRFRGSAIVCSWLLRFIPFIDHRVNMILNGKTCRLNIKYPTHAAFLRKQFEPIETLLVLSILNEGDTFMDLGANWGYFTFIGSVAVGETGKVVAVEANPKTFCRMQNTLQQTFQTNVISINCALSDKDGEPVTINLPWYKMDTSSFISKSDTSVIMRDQVITRTIDLIWNQLGSPSVKLVKIDVEGAEMLLLSGGKQLFGNGLVRVVLMEVENWSHRFGSNPAAIYDRMRDFGFTHIYAISEGIVKKIRYPESGAEPFTGNILFGRSNLDKVVEDIINMNHDQNYSDEA